MLIIVIIANLQLSNFKKWDSNPIITIIDFLVFKIPKVFDYKNCFILAKIKHDRMN